jgi:hypothetical protein
MATAAAVQEENTDNDENLVLDSNDDFDSMFDSLADPGSKEEGENDQEEVEGEESGEAGAADGEAGDGEESEGAGGTEEGEEAGEDDEGDKPGAGSGQESDSDVRARLEALERVRDANATDKGKPPAEPVIYSDDELAAIEKYTSEWGDVAKGEQLIRRAEAVENTNFIFAEVAKFMKPYIDIIEHVANADHVNTIYGAHSDYDKVYPQVEKWVETQPAITKRAYQQVIKAGTADDVVELVTTWKKETGYKPPAAGDAAPATENNEGKGAPKPGANAGKPALSPEKLAAAKKLAGVNRGRGSPVNQGADPGDFNSAFDEFAGK